MAAQILIVAGSLPFLVLGSLHGLYTLLDTGKPRRLIPGDIALMEAMQQTPVRMASTTTMWRAWVGFNLTHSLGLVFFGLIYLLLAMFDFEVLAARPLLVLLALPVAGAYFAMSVKYFFIIPTIGAGLGALCFALAAILI